MKTFECLQELLDYIPNCIICQKVMELRIEGSVPARSNPDYYLREKVYLKMFLFEEKLHSKRCKDYSFTIDPKNNQLFSGKDLLNRMISSSSFQSIAAIKKCHTCHFKISTTYSNGTVTAKLHQFPVMQLYTEELSYTMKREKQVRIYKTYNDTYHLTGEKATVVVNHRHLEFNLDLSKIQDLDHLNNKIKTVMVFQ